MKRAKIALTAIAMFAVVGGALAFKSYRGVNSFCRVSTTPGVCTTTYISTTHDTAPLTTGLTTYCTLVPGAQCTQTATNIRFQQ